jgi:CubicO group peptidase (beta-lactamase class C family)
MFKRFHVSFALFLFLFCWISLISASEVDFSPAGRWEGAIEIPGMKLEIDVDFIRNADGSWKGDITIPAQNARDLPLTGITLQGKEICFAISGIPGDPAFKGKISEDGSSILGDFTQAGQTFPFRLERGAGSIAKAQKALEGFDKVVEDALKPFKVPGMALAIVKNDKVIYAKGFGFRDVENKLPMTADTLLAIGSATKAFTAFALGTLADQGKMEWDVPVRTYIPWFRLQDNYLGEHLTPRDLVTHRSGLPRHDLVWYNNYSASREEFVRSLAHLQATAGLRERFQYNNLMFLTAGYLIEVLTGKSWEEAIRATILEPLGMTRTNFSVDDSQKDSDFAQPYGERDKKVQKIPFRRITNIGPAGSINSSVNEMSHWLIAHLNGGLYQDKKIINAATLQDMHLAHMPMGQTPADPRISPGDYGLGWMIDHYRGHSRVHHGGSIDGFLAMVSLFPEDGLGFVALANLSGTGLPELAIRTAADRLLGLEPVDWLGEGAKRIAEGDKLQDEAQKKAKARRRPGTSPAHKLEEYAGLYAHPGYGELKIFLEGNRLSFTFNGITTPLEHWHYETFSGGEAPDPAFKDGKLNFRTDVDGNVAELVVPMDLSADPIVFTKKPDARYFDPKYLEKRAGKYELQSQILTVSLKGSILTLYIPGQPGQELVPLIGGEFALKLIKAITVRFIEDAQGQVVSMELNQPNGVFEAKRAKQ